MARKKKRDLDAAKAAAAPTTPETEEVIDKVDLIDDSIPVVDPAPKKPSKPVVRTEDEKAVIAAVKPIKRYLVVRGGRIMHRRLLATLPSGKTIKETEYNIPQLLQQGIELDELKE